MQQHDGGFWLSPWPVSIIVRGPHFHPPSVAVVPRQWAEHALLWLQRSQLQPPALCSRASTHNTTKPNPEVRNRNPSSLLMFKKKKKKSLIKQGEGREACPFDRDSAVMIREGRQRTWEFPHVLLHQLEAILNGISTHPYPWIGTPQADRDSLCFHLW